MSEKNNIIAQKSASELYSATIRDIQVQRDRKRSLTNELAANVGSMKEAKARIARVKMACDDDDDDQNQQCDSQESHIAEILECDTFIAEYESHRCEHRKLLKSFFRDTTNDL